MLPGEAEEPAAYRDTMMDSKYNFKLINKAGKDIKSAIY